jgi:hypothetical protein
MQIINVLCDEYKNFIKALAVFFVAAFVLSFVLPAHAEVLMSLPKLDGYKKFTTTNGRDYQGQCGSAKIVVENVYYERPDLDFSNLNSGLITESVVINIVDSTKPKRVLKPPVNDYDGIACVQTTQGKRILIWENCAKNGCTTSYDSFYIIDPENLVYTAPQDPKTQECDRQCAKPLVGDIKPLAFLFHTYTKDDWLMSLPAIKEHRQFKTKDGQTYNGECGTAKIIVRKVYFHDFDDSMDHQSAYANTFSNLDPFDQTKGVVTEFEITDPANPGKVLKPSASDNNGIACMQTPRGKLIVMWGRCSRSECSNDNDTRYVIDPEKLAYIGNAGDDICDEECARPIFGDAFVDYVKNQDTVQNRDSVATRTLARKLPTHTEKLMSLPKLLGYEEFTTTDKINYYGQCGSARIEVKGVFKVANQNPPNAGYFNAYANTNEKSDDGGSNTFEIQNPAKPDQALEVNSSDRNGIACVPTAQGKRILIWQSCIASACDGQVDTFYAIDPEALTFVAPREPLNEVCDATCAKHIFGDALIDYVQHYKDGAYSVEPKPDKTH